MHPKARLWPARRPWFHTQTATVQPPNEELGSPGGHAHRTVPTLLSPLAVYRFPTPSFPLLTYTSFHFSLGAISLPRPLSWLPLFSFCSSLLRLGGISLLFYHLAPLAAQIHPQGASGLPEAHGPTGTDFWKPRLAGPPPITVCHLLLCRGLEIWPVEFLFCFSLRHERTDFIFLWKTKSGT